MNLLVRNRAAVPLERFQAEIVSAMTERLLRTSRPLLLRSPTGSGKTMMIGRALDGSAVASRTLWFWFVPYTNLVSQTINALQGSCVNLHLAELVSGLRFEHRPGDVLVGTAASVSSATQSRDVLAPKDESLPSLFDAVARARGAGLRIGMVVDEAHIGLAEDREFGRFCRRLSPDRLIMASATPSDERLNAFLAAAEYPDFESFSVSRDEVVDARLNKPYVAAVVYRPDEQWQGLADLKKTVLRHAWAQHQIISSTLFRSGISLTPLMLVQVANGQDTMREAVDYLIRDCGIPPDKIGKYEGADGNPTELQRIAHDPTVEVLVFKEAAGTGFDAPRAFILTSTKNVVDIDFATQFVGRIMRVPSALRSISRQSYDNLEPDLKTGFVYLADARAQHGFQHAVQQLQAMKGSLEGAIETLRERRLPGGGVVFTNRPTQQPALTMLLPMAWRQEDESSADRRQPQSAVAMQAGLFSRIAEIDQPGQDRPVPPTIPRRFETLDDLINFYREQGVELYLLRREAEAAPRCLLSEHMPKIADLRNVVRAVVRRLQLEEIDIFKAAAHAYGNARGTQVVTNLITLIETEEAVPLEIDRRHLAAEVLGALATLPQSSTADAAEMIRAVTKRIEDDVRRWMDIVVPSAHRSEDKDRRTVRDAAYLLLRAKREEVAATFSAEVARTVAAQEADPLPDALAFFRQWPLERSRKNLYGIMPPTLEQTSEALRTLTIDERRLLRSRIMELKDQGHFQVEGLDNAWALNASEKSFAQRLDGADFVIWWARNPDRKPYSSGVVRADGGGKRFYPDFIVCVRYWNDDEPSVRMIETKFDVVDAERKSRRRPATYGRVLFLRADETTKRFHLLNEKGELGPEVGTDLAGLKEALRESTE